MPTHASSTTFFSPKYFPLDFIGGYHGKECPSPDYDFECPPPLPPTLLDIPFIWFENVLVYKFQVTPPPSEKKYPNIIKCV